jgi:hypothetical protein
LAAGCELWRVACAGLGGASASEYAGECECRLCVSFALWGASVCGAVLGGGRRGQQCRQRGCFDVRCVLRAWTRDVLVLGWQRCAVACGLSGIGEVLCGMGHDVVMEWRGECCLFCWE